MKIYTATINPLALAEFAASFWSKVDRSGEHWLFKAKARSGSLNYGFVKIPKHFKCGRENVLAHRVAFFLTHGHWPNRTRHTCDIPLCVKPDHLIEGTQKENVQDSVKRGRARNGNIKLNPEIWATIRASTERNSVLAIRYGVHPAHISKIKRGKVSVYRP